MDRIQTRHGVSFRKQRSGNLAAMTRDDGTPVQVGDWWWVENDQVHFAPPPPIADVPNRLYGATINHEGDAV